MKLKTIAIDDTGVALLYDEFQTYASVPGDGDKSMQTLMQSCLRSAILKVQEYADTALVQTTFELTVDADDSRTVRLYEGGKVLSVTDAEGHAVQYNVLGDGRVVAGATGALRIKYQTQPKPGDLDNYKLTIFRYALADLDGDSWEVKNGILNEAL